MQQPVRKDSAGSRAYIIIYMSIGRAGEGRAGKPFLSGCLSLSC